MNSKTVLTAVISLIAGLGLAMGTVAFAKNSDHMGGGMMGQSAQQYSHGNNMHDQNVTKGKRGSKARKADASKSTGNNFCHSDTIAKSGSKTKKLKNKSKGKKRT
ncbi:MAG: hypothetical protein ACC641_10400 [Acidiferrobacterales bacterium]